MKTLDLAIEKLRRHTVVAASGCWLWVGYTQPNGYGVVNVNGYKIPAHRLALMSVGIEMPKALDACHRCDVRNCVNPAHLYPGTRRQNMADCSARNRHNKPSGEAHWRAKLTADQVRTIRKLRTSGHSTISLGTRFGVSPATISRIARHVWRKEVA